MGSRLPVRAALLGIGATVLAGCSLTTSLDGLATGGAEEAGAGGPGTPPPGAPPVDGGCPTCGSSDGSVPDADAGSSDANDSGGSAVPITFVQSNTIKPTALVTTLSLNSAVAAHDAIVVCLNFPVASGATLSQITDTLGNVYSVVVGPIVGNTATHYVAVALDSKAGSDTISVTASVAPASGSDLFALEYSGLALSSAFDVSASNAGSATAMQSGSAATTFPHELIVGYGEGSNVSAGAGFTGRATVSGNLIEDKVVSSMGTYEATATTPSGGWEMILATFRGR